MLKNLRISLKLAVLTAVIFLSLSVAFFYAFQIIQNTLIKQSSDGTHEVIKQTTNNLKNILDEIDDLAMKISRDDEIGQLVAKLDSVKDENERTRISYQIKPLLDEYLESKTEIDSALIVTPKYNSAISGQNSVRFADKLKDSIVIKAYLESGKKSLWYDTYKRDVDINGSGIEPGGRTITLAKDIYTSTSLKSVGVLYFFIKEIIIKDIVKEVNLTNDGIMYILGERNNIVYNPLQPDHGSLLLSEVVNGQNKELRYVSEEAYNEIMQKKIGALNKKVSGEDSLITFKKIDDIKGTPLGWTLVSVTKNKDISKSINDTLLQLLVIIVICMAFSSAFAVFITRDITGSIRKLVKIMEVVKDGDLNIQFKHDRKDEIGYLERSFENMVNSLRDLINKIKNASRISVDSSQAVTSSCEENYASIEELNSLLHFLVDDFHKQSHNAVLGKKEVVIIKEKIHNAKSNIDVTDEIIEKSKELSGINKNSVALLYKMSDNIKKAMVMISKEFKELISASSEIGKITQAITNISDQTRLLALNASIESAKAGVYGKSFALVADEVKKLSTQSKEFVTNIDLKVKNIVGKIEKAGNSVSSLNGVVEESEHTIEGVISSFDNNVDFLNTIIDQVENIKDSINSIESSGNDIIGIIENISTSIESNKGVIESINVTTGEQFSMVEQLVEKSEELLRLSQDLEGAANTFND